MRLELTALVLGSALTALSMQSPPPATKPAPRSPVGDTIDQMQGAWKLVDLQARLLPEDRRQEAGYCVVSGIYMTLEVHVGWMGPEGQVAGVDLSTGTHRVELVGANRIRSSSLIGSFINKNGKLEFEQPGKARNFAVVFVGTRMTFEREDGNKYVFEKLGDWRERKDFYGRVIKDKPKDAPTKSDDGG